MAKSIDQQIKDTMAKKVVGRTTEIYKAVVLELYQRITANSLQVGLGVEHEKRKILALLTQPVDLFFKTLFMTDRVTGACFSRNTTFDVVTRGFEGLQES